MQKGRENEKEIGREGKKEGKRNSILVIIIIPKRVKGLKKFHGNLWLMEVLRYSQKLPDKVHFLRIQPNGDLACSKSNRLNQTPAGKSCSSVP